MNRDRHKTVTKILFALYLLFLTWVVLFKMQTDFAALQTGRRSINLIPFQGSAIVNGKIDLSEIILNVIAFIPFGIYVGALNENWNFLKKAAPAFCFSLFYEFAQYVFGIGASDITDLTGNTLGGMSGILIYWILSKVLKQHAAKAVNILAGIGTAFVFAFSFLLIIANA